jgi:uncharacterized protein YeaO (DUF488 family)
MLKIKRVYEPKESSDGKRILVDRLWPRGISKDKAFLFEWMKDLAPSDELRKWFAHEPEKWAEFRRRYRAELDAEEQKALLEKIAQLASKGSVTLVYGAKDTEHNNAVVLEELIGKSQPAKT